MLIMYHQTLLRFLKTIFRKALERKFINDFKNITDYLIV